MILFVFEGCKREVQIFNTMQELFFPEDNSDKIKCSYGNNIYSLYERLKDPESDCFDQDIVSVLKTDSVKSNGASKGVDFQNVSEFSQVYLFFDFDIHNQNKSNSISIQELQNRLSILL